MRIGVVGLGHLGTVTAACLAEYHDVVCYQPGLDPQVHPYLNQDDPGVAHLFEQAQNLHGLRIAESIDSFFGVGATFDPVVRMTLHHRVPELLWVCFDAQRIDDYAINLELTRTVLIHARPGTLVVVSSPVVAGTMAKLAAEFTALRFAYQPENLRIGKGVIGFKGPERIVCGLQHVADREVLQDLFKPFAASGDGIFWMSIESAEMVKHGINAFLATTIAFANEFGKFCIKHGANPKDVERGLKSDSRIGQRAYVSYGYPPGDHLSRDVEYLAAYCGGIFESVKKSNEEFSK